MPDVRHLQRIEAAYVAGIVDGEGTITLTKTHRGENRRPIVSISSTERPLLEYVQLVIGAGRITNKRRSRAHHSASFTFVISSRNALTLLAFETAFFNIRTRAPNAPSLPSRSHANCNPTTAETVPILAAKAYTGTL